MDITKCLTISTMHISLETEEKLLEEEYKNNMFLTVYRKSNFGFWIYVPCDKDEFHTDNVPKDLRGCMDLAHENDCRWLCLDCDGEDVDCLQKYDW